VDIFKGLREAKQKIKEEIQTPKPEDLGSGSAYQLARMMKKRKKAQEAFLND
jgi:hypothetical protein